jgi:hypothetical protein
MMAKSAQSPTAKRGLGFRFPSIESAKSKIVRKAPTGGKQMFRATRRSGMGESDFDARLDICCPYDSAKDSWVVREDT